MHASNWSRSSLTLCICVNLHDAIGIVTTMNKNAFGYSEHLPENIREIFMWLCQDVVSLQQKWDFYQELFGKTQNTVLLSELAPGSFNIIFETLQNELTMAICRLRDPSTTKGKANISFEALLDKCTNMKEVEDLLSEFKRISKPLSQRRNKRVGHRDLDTVIKPFDNPIPGFSSEQINTILQLAVDILNSVLQQYENSELCFHFATCGGASTLIYWLRMAKESCNFVNHPY